MGAGWSVVLNEQEDDSRSSGTLVTGTLAIYIGKVLVATLRQTATQRDL